MAQVLQTAGKEGGVPIKKGRTCLQGEPDFRMTLSLLEAYLCRDCPHGWHFKLTHQYLPEGMGMTRRLGKQDGSRFLRGLKSQLSQETQNSAFGIQMSYKGFPLSLCPPCGNTTRGQGTLPSCLSHYQSPRPWGSTLLDSRINAARWADTPGNMRVQLHTSQKVSKNFSEPKETSQGDSPG